MAQVCGVSENKSVFFFLPHMWHCGVSLDALGHHGLSCRYNAGCFPRYAYFNDVVKCVLVPVGIPSGGSLLNMGRGNGRRPDGTTAFPYIRAHSRYCDSTYVDTFSASSIFDIATSPGSVANRAEFRHKDKHSCSVDWYQLKPVVAETTGLLWAFQPSHIFADSQEVFSLRQVMMGDSLGN